MTKFYSCILSLLCIVTIASAQTTVTLQPGAVQGKDAHLDSYYPNTNGGSVAEINSLAWTIGGNPMLQHGIVEFDLSVIPPCATIQSAYLTLYNNPNSTNGLLNGEHSQLSGSNESYLRRVITSWSENTVTWNNQPTTTTLNQVYVPANTTPNEDYTLDVTQLVNDMVDSPSVSFGFMISLITEQYYRCLLFASSDHPNAALHPKLVITYTVNGSYLVLQPGAASGKDAHIDDYYPNTNGGTVPELNSLAWTIGGTPMRQRGLIEFNVTSIPVGATVQMARLTLYNNPTSSNGFLNGEHSHYSGSNQSSLKRVTSAWNENTVTWNNQPSTTSVNQVTLPQDIAAHQNYVLDVTQHVQDMVNNPVNNFGFMLQLDTEQYYRCLLFASSDHVDSTIHPKLEICYTSDNCIHLDLQPGPVDGKDVMLDDYYPNTNSGNGEELNSLAWTVSGTPMAQRSLLQFDLSAIPLLSIITSAELTLYNNPTSTNGLLNGEHSQLSGSNQSWLRRVVTAWTENTVTWNTAPLTTATNETSLPADTDVHQDYVIDVRNLVQDMVNNPSTSFGFMLQLDTEQYYRCLLFASSDHPNTALHPKLNICYKFIETGISETHNEPFSVFPNPNNGDFEINFQYDMRDAVLKIFNALGAEVYNEHLKGNIAGRRKFHLDFASGIYILVLQAGEHSYTQRLVVN
jgi:hypothetical protein